MSGDITLPIEDLRKVFDTAVHSLDFGSGFLDDEEVAALRRIAVRLGVDEMEATPSMFRSKYPHAFHAYRYRDDPPSEHCSVCSAKADHPVHAR